MLTLSEKVGIPLALALRLWRSVSGRIIMIAHKLTSGSKTRLLGARVDLNRAYSAIICICQTQVNLATAR